MATITLSVSLPIELGNWLAENPEVSPSKVLQQRLYSIRDDEERIKLRLKAAETIQFRTAARLNKVLEYCEQHNLEIPNDVLAV